MTFLNSKTYSKTFIILGAFLLAFALLVFLLVLLGNTIKPSKGNVRFFEVQSIDTMKYSRDLALETKSNPLFENTINKQVADIAATGATHVAIGTPYDEKFYPVLTMWVTAARKNNLNVWFRGNFSGWEGWFNFGKIDRSEHIKKTQEFILNHPDIFADGDLFTACPECENGGPGDPRKTRDIEGHRKFLIDEYKVTKDAFSKIGKKVSSNYNSMNGDVAELIMDRKTTGLLDGLVVIDHYVADPSKLLSDIEKIAAKSGGKVVLGEFGAPIPDIHGVMNQDQQYDYLNKVFAEIIRSENLIGINYWVNIGGSTELWDSSGNERKALRLLISLYKPRQMMLNIRNEINEVIPDLKVTVNNTVWKTNSSDQIQIPVFEDYGTVLIEAPDYKSKSFSLDEINNNTTIKLQKEHESVIFRSEKFLNNFIFFSN